MCDAMAMLLHHYHPQALMIVIVTNGRVTRFESLGFVLVLLIGEVVSHCLNALIASVKEHVLQSRVIVISHCLTTTIVMV